MRVSMLHPYMNDLFSDHERFICVPKEHRRAVHRVGLQAAEAFADDLGGIGDRDESAFVCFPYKLS